jgi:hypothetical protein
MTNRQTDRRKREASDYLVRIDDASVMPRTVTLTHKCRFCAQFGEHPTMPNKAPVEDDGDKRVFFGRRDLSRSLLRTSRARTLASLRAFSTAPHR